MAENNTQTPDAVPTDDAVVVPTRLQTFVINHPRAAKAVAIAGAAGTAVGVALFAKTLQTNKDHLDAAADHAKEALNELSTSAVPQDPEA